MVFTYNGLIEQIKQEKEGLIYLSSQVPRASIRLKSSLESLNKLDAYPS